MEYTIPLRKGYYKAPQHTRSNRAMKVLQEYLVRHTKADEIKIGQHLNEYIWARGIRNPPARVTVVSNVSEIDGKKVAQVELKGNDFKESVRPAERVEQEGGLKGKLQQFTQGAAKKEAPAAAPVKEESKPKSE